MNKIDFVKHELAQIIFHGLNDLNKDHGLALDDISQSIEVPTDTTKGDYAFPCFKLAKSLRKAPPQIANDIATIINQNKSQFI